MLEEEERKKQPLFNLAYHWLSYKTFFKKIKGLKIQSQGLLIIEIKQVNSTNVLL